MYACCYFVEDASLYVGAKGDAKLEVLGDFLEGSKVQRKWSKKQYNGVIIKVHGKHTFVIAPEFLTDSSLRAYKHTIVKNIFVNFTTIYF